MDNVLALLKGNKISLKLLSVLIIILALNSCAKPKPTPAVYAHWTASQKSLKEKNETPSYTIDAKYPEISSYPQTKSAQALNQMIHDYVAASIQSFKDRAPLDTPELDDYPDGMHINSFQVDYAYHQIKTPRETIVSVRLETATKLLGESTHIHHFVVFNYDMNHNKLISLDSLFKPDSDYLKVLATYCQKQLSKRLADGMYWMPYDPTYTGAYPQNFTIWNLDKQGIAITFQEFQVTPYSYKPTVVIVPYSRLRSVLADDSPVRTFAYGGYPG